MTRYVSLRHVDPETSSHCLHLALCSAEMSKKRSRNTENRSLRAVIDQQLAAAAEEIFRLLKERGPAELEVLKELVTERITAAVEEIFTALRAIRPAEREQEAPGESPRPGPGAGRTG